MLLFFHSVGNLSLPPFILNTPVQRNHGFLDREFPHSIGIMIRGVFSMNGGWDYILPTDVHIFQVAQPPTCDSLILVDLPLAITSYFAVARVLSHCILGVSATA